MLPSAYLDEVIRVATVLDVFQFAGTPMPANWKTLFRCPLPGHIEKTGSFHVLPSLKGFCCFGCNKKGGVLQLAVALGIVNSPREALDKLADLHHIPRPIAERQAHVMQWKPRRVTPTVTLLPPEIKAHPSEEQREKLRRALTGSCSILSREGAAGAAYLRSRCINPNFASANDVKYHRSWLGMPAVIFAVRDSRGNVVAVQGRYLDTSVKPKTKSFGNITNGVYRTYKTLEGLDVVAITEAPFDALSLATYGLPTLALLGSAVKPWLRRYLKFLRVIIATDADVAGEEAAAELRRFLDLSQCDRLTFPGYKDANDAMQRDGALFAKLIRAIAPDVATVTGTIVSVRTIDEATTIALKSDSRECELTQRFGTPSQHERSCHRCLKIKMVRSLGQDVAMCDECLLLVYQAAEACGDSAQDLIDYATATLLKL